MVKKPAYFITSGESVYVALNKKDCEKFIKQRRNPDFEIQMCDDIDDDILKEFRDNIISEVDFSPECDESLMVMCTHHEEYQIESLCSIIIDSFLQTIQCLTDAVYLDYDPDGLNKSVTNSIGWAMDDLVQLADLLGYRGSSIIDRTKLLVALAYNSPAAFYDEYGKINAKAAHRVIIASFT